MLTAKIPTEHCEQVNFVNWFEYNYPQHKIFAIPNGEKRSISVAKRLKAEGVRSGVPDLFIPSLRLFIEMKRQKGGRVSESQKEWITYLKRCGFAVEICNGCDSAKEVINNLLTEINK